MAIEKNELENLLRNAFPNAELEIKDLVGDNDHYQVSICSDSFKGLTKIKQHQMVYEALGNIVGNKLHALSLTTKHY